MWSRSGHHVRKRECVVHPLRKHNKSNDRRMRSLAARRVRRTSRSACGYSIDGVQNKRTVVMPNFKIAAVTAAAVLGSTMMVGASAAMPLNGLPQASKQVAADVHDVRLVCGPRGCW